MSVRDAFDGEELVDALALAGSGDQIRLTRDFGRWGPYVLPQDLSVTDKSLDITVPSHVSLVKLDFGKRYSWKWSYGAGSFRTLIEGGINIVGTRPGAIWTLYWTAATRYNIDEYVIPNPANGFMYRCSVPGVSAGVQPTFPTGLGDTVTDGGVTWVCENVSEALLHFQSTAAAGSLSLECNGISVDGGNMVDRCFQAASGLAGGAIDLLITDAEFTGARDDNFNGSQHSASVANLVNWTIRNSRFVTSLRGCGATAHYYAIGNVYDSYFEGHRLGPMSTGPKAQMTGTRCYYDIPSDLCSGTVDGSPNGTAYPFNVSCFGLSGGDTLTIQDSTILSRWVSGGRNRIIGAVPNAATVSTMKFIRCTIEQQRSAGVFSVTGNGVLRIEDTVVTHTGDPRNRNESGTAAGAFTYSDVGILTMGAGATADVIRSTFDQRSATDRSGTQTYAMFDLTGTARVRGSLLIRHNFTTQQIGVIVRTGIDTAASYVRGCTIVGRKVAASGDQTAIHDAINMTVATKQIRIEGSIIVGFNNGINAVTSYPGVGYNVFKNMVNKNVPTFGTKATDRPASNSSNTSAALTFVGNTYATLNARLAIAQDATLLNTSFDIEQIESFILTLEAAGPGAVTRAPLASDQFTQPVDAGCYANETTGITVTLTATPDADATFVGWSGDYATANGTTATVVMTAAKTVRAHFMPNAVKALPPPPPIASAAVMASRRAAISGRR